MTERYKFCVLEYNAAAGACAPPRVLRRLPRLTLLRAAGELITRANGDVQDRMGRPAEAGQVCAGAVCTSFVAPSRLTGVCPLRLASSTRSAA